MKSFKYLTGKKLRASIRDEISRTPKYCSIGVLTISPKCKNLTDYSAIIEAIAYTYNIRPIWTRYMLANDEVVNGIKLVGYESNLGRCSNLINWVITTHQQWADYSMDKMRKGKRKLRTMGKSPKYLGDSRTVSREKIKRHLEKLVKDILKKLDTPQFKNRGTYFKAIDEFCLFAFKMKVRTKLLEVKARKMRSVAFKFNINTYINGNLKLYTRKDSKPKHILTKARRRILRKESERKGLPSKPIIDGKKDKQPSNVNGVNG